MSQFKNRKMATPGGKTKKRGRMNKAHRYTSNVFSMFSQAQIQEFKVLQMFHIL